MSNVSIYIILLLLLFVALWYIWKQRREINRLRRAAVHIEDLIKQMYMKKQHSLTLKEAMELWNLNRDDSESLLAMALRYGWLQRRQDEDDYRLTEAGETLALHLVRAHRLYEKYLAEKTGYLAEEWHQKAETMEHELSRQHVERLSQDLSNPIYDPHGSTIPKMGDAPSLVLDHKAKVEDEDGRRSLWDLEEDEEAEISGLGYQLAGDRRKRLLDLGFVRGSRVRTYLDSPSGAGKAFLIRDTAIALREDQAKYIYIKSIAEA